MSSSRILRVLLCASVSTATLPLAAQDVGDEQSITQPGEPSVEQASGGSPPTVNADDPPQAALEHYLKGRRHYLAGRYRDALAELKAALDYDHNAPDLLYNVARVYENLGELDEAIEYYQRYLAVIPSSELEERDRTEKTIRRLQGAMRESADRGAGPATQPEAPATTHAGRADLAFWLTGGAALALLAGGATCGLLAIRKYDSIGEFVVGKDGTLEERDNMSDDAKRFALLADGLFVASGVALTTAAFLFLLRDADEPQPQVGAWRFGLNVGDRRAELSLRGRF